jgi:3-ketoacyl-CoA synthase
LLLRCAGVVAIDLARQMLQLYPDSYALVVSHENLTNNWYPGCDRSMLVPNCIFRANGAAILLSNKGRDAYRAKYELKHVVRTTISSDEAFGCVYQMEDDKGKFAGGEHLQMYCMRAGACSSSAQLLSAWGLVIPTHSRRSHAV